MIHDQIPVDLQRQAGRVTALLLSLLFVASCAAPGAPDSATAEDGSAQELVFPPPPEQPRFYFERTIMSSSDVVVEDSEAKWRRILTGETASALGFSKPFDVQACQGRIYVSDTVRRAALGSRCVGSVGATPGADTVTIRCPGTRRRRGWVMGAKTWAPIG